MLAFRSPAGQSPHPESGYDPDRHPGGLPPIAAVRVNSTCSLPVTAWVIRTTARPRNRTIRRSFSCVSLVAFNVSAAVEALQHRGAQLHKIGADLADAASDRPPHPTELACPYLGGVCGGCRHGSGGWNPSGSFAGNPHARSSWL